MTVAQEQRIGRLTQLFVNDPANAGQFIKMCIANSSLETSSTLNLAESAMRDCANPLAIPETEVAAVSKSAKTVSFEGKFTVEAYAVASAIHEAGLKRRFRVALLSPADGSTIIAYREGDGFISDLGDNEPDEDFETASGTITFSGGAPFTVGAPA